MSAESFYRLGKASQTDGVNPYGSIYSNPHGEIYISFNPRDLKYSYVPS